MDKFQVHSPNLCADETDRTTLLRSAWVISAANSIWRCRAPASLGCVVLFAVGCAHTSFLQRPLAFASSRSIAAFRSNDTPAKKGEGLGSTRIVMASWYGPGYDGKRTSSGERFDPSQLTAASRTLPLDSIVRVTNLRNGRSVEVKVNDRGPRIRRRGLDLSPAAARRIGLTHRGVGRVKITPVMNPTTNE
jgi:rare lipoprotein A